MPVEAGKNAIAAVLWQNREETFSALIFADR
jgi:hypothetical protein